MFKKFKNLMLLAFASSTLLVPVAVPVAASAVTNSITNGVCQGVNNATAGTNGTDCGNAGTGNADLSSIASKVINIFSIIVGIVAVIMIIYGGFKYVTSGGESGNVSSAKTTLIYAIVGLIIVALAQFIVHFVLNTATNATTAT